MLMIRLLWTVFSPRLTLPLILLNKPGILHGINVITGIAFIIALLNEAEKF
jgi:hypothetical protein